MPKAVEAGGFPPLDPPIQGRTYSPTGAPTPEARGDDFVIVVPVPGTRPRAFVVEIRRCKAGDEYGVTQVSEQMGRKAADSLSAKWAKWHRLEVHIQ